MDGNRQMCSREREFTGFLKIYLKFLFEPEKLSGPTNFLMCPRSTSRDDQKSCRKVYPQAIGEIIRRTHRRYEPIKPIWGMGLPKSCRLRAASDMARRNSCWRQIFLRQQIIFREILRAKRFLDPAASKV
ncbi:MAG: hypothetical protein EB144_07025 [Actinobacteria bacterium]|nr:hypothetical protein [Actinomycetota bacterium]